MTRRRLLAGASALLIAGAIAVANRSLFYDAITEERNGAILDAPTALERVQRGTLVLVDIRRPDEWERTGRPEGSLALDMRRPDFTAALSELVGGNRSAPIALICARGVRSARLSNRLIEAGFDNIHDVPEGMLGSSAGPGWLARGLPLENG